MTIVFALAGCGKDGGQGSDSASSDSLSSSGSHLPAVLLRFSEDSSSSQSTSDTAFSSSGTSSSGSDSGSSSSSPEIVTITFREGCTFMQIANWLEQYGVCSAQDFYEAAQNYQVQSFQVPSDSDRCFKMEGFLFPDTYEFYEGEDPEDVLRKMLNNYASKSGLPSQETLILASIIEQEARSTENMRLVSSVYHNRLDAGMRLESDPTREYVNNFITGNRLLGDTSKYAALFNTYKCKGLPVGPICNP
ncbi:MAG: endolytic transglycosylase MltG, partial [Oscillospiraceae bacterium]